MEETSLHRNTLLFVLFLLLIGISNVLDPTGWYSLDTLLFCFRFSVSAGLLMFWIQTLRVRLLPGRIRSYMMAAAMLMLLFLILEVMRFRLAMTTWEARLCWYGYYIPVLTVPTLFLMGCVRYSRRRDQQPDEGLLLIPVMVLILIILTNELHHLAFLPNPGMEENFARAGTYTYGLFYFAAWGWSGFCLLGGMGLMLFDTGRNGEWLRGLIFFLFVLLIPVLLAGHVFLQSLELQPPYLFPEICIFCILGALESSIRCRILPFNDNYPGFFAGMSIPAMITGPDLLQVYKTAVPLDAAEQQLRAARSGPVQLDEDTQLIGQPLRGGYVFWENTQRELHRRNRELTRANEVLDEENDLIRAENTLREQKARLDAQNEVYDRIARELYPTQKKIETLLEAASPESPDFRANLGVCCVLGAYSKRKSNLLLAEGTLPRRNQELFLALQESARFLGCCGVEAAAVGGSWSELPLETVHGLYDAFETIIEAFLPAMKRLTVSVTEGGIRLAVEAEGTLPPLPETGLPATARFSDGICYVSVDGRGGAS